MAEIRRAGEALLPGAFLYVWVNIAEDGGVRCCRQRLLGKTKKRARNALVQEQGEKGHNAAFEQIQRRNA